MKTVPTLRFIVALTFLASVNNYTFSQNIGINGNGNNADPSALLDVDAVATPSLGILIPRIALQAINVAAPITSPATSLLLFNTATASTGTNAVSPGYYYWDGTKWVRFLSIQSNDWGLTGNAGTTAGTNFVGTTDNQDLVFKRNGIQAGLINSSLNNTSFGVSALNPSSTGMWNIAIGNQSMQNLTTGNMNVGVGYTTLSANTTGFANTAIGQNAMRTNSVGNFNTAIGEQVMFANTTGEYNTVVGSRALITNTSGSYNTSIGWGSMHDNTLAGSNTAIGYYSLFANTTGSLNVAAGNNALVNNVSGNSNVAIGNLALRYSSNGNNNTAIGTSAGAALSTYSNQSNNTFVGANSDVTANNLTNATAIGYNAKVSLSNALVLGGTGTDAVKVGIGLTVPAYPLHVFNGSIINHTAVFENNIGANTAIIALNSAPTSTNTGDAISAFNNGQAGGNAVYGKHSNPNGTAIFGIGQNATGHYMAVGSGAAMTGNDAALVADALGVNSTGVRAMGNGVALYPALISGGGGAFSGVSNGVYGNAASTTTNIAGGYFSNDNGDYAYVGYRSISNVSQKINGTGAVSTIVKNTKNELVNLYCPEAPEVLFQDFGKGTLVNGEAHIALDETFIKNVHISDKHPLRVIIQLEGDCKGVYVTDKTSTGFVVKELQGGNSNVAFTYFVTANRADAYNEDGTLFSKFEDVRYGVAPAKAETKNEKAETVKKK